MPARIRTAAMVILLLGAWGALVPFIGPLFGYSMSGVPAWTWNESHVTLHLIPGVVAVIGAMLVLRARRSSVQLGAVLAALGGAWFVLAPTFHPAWADSSAGGGMMMMHGTWSQIASSLGYHYGIGVVILGLAMHALGRLARLDRQQTPVTTRPNRPNNVTEESAFARDDLRVGSHRVG